MKNKLAEIIFISLVGILVAIPTFAATFILSPTNVNVSQGQLFNVTVALDPQSVKSYTSKLELKYPADLLEVKSFSFVSKWLALSAEGYDLIDNTNGVMIKSAGYPQGTLNSVTFGIVSFTAKKSGSGSVTVGSNSVVYNANNSNVFSTSPSQVTVAVAGRGTPTLTPTPALTKSRTPSPTITATPSPTASPGASPTPISVAGPTFMAQIGNLVSLGTGNTFVGILIVVVIVAAAYVAYRKIRGKKEPGL